MATPITLGSNSEGNIKSLEDTYELSLYTKRDLIIESGQGAILYDIQGNSYFDCAAGIGVANVGHNHPKIKQAIVDQLNKIITVPEIIYSPTRGRLLKKLIEISPEGMEHAFLCNSGTEANEAAIKFARFTTGRTDFICCMRSFHGRTIGSLSATFKKEYRTPFEPLLPNFTFVPFNNLGAIKNAITENTAGIIIELVQGEGGIHIAEKDYIQGIQQLCHENNILFIVDEVQTGFGRTGEIFACNHYGISPDILTVAKSIAGGLPMGATICNGKIKMQSNLHGSTFGGNPLVCASSLAVIEVLTQEGFMNEIQEKGDYFNQKLTEIDSPVIRNIRGMGLMLGIELKTRVYPYLELLLANGVIALPAGTTVIRLLPPLTISKEEIDKIINILRSVLKEALP